MGIEFLVGHTGFVGSNLAAEHRFSGLFNSKNIAEAFGKHPDLLVYAGVPAEMFLANQNPEEDRKRILEAEENIRRIAPARVVLISTIAVYPDTHGADEHTHIDDQRLTPYGAHRHELETWVEKNYDRHLIVRLPALYGRNLKKNFLYDYIHVIPAKLNRVKMDELSARDPQLLRYYQLQGNGFYQCRSLTAAEEAELKARFKALGFSALHFTDSRSRYQFYPLRRLWEHIDLALANDLQRLNIVTAPLQVGELYQELCGGIFHNELDQEPFDYDLRSKYAHLLGGRDGYLLDRDEILEDITLYIASA